MTEPTTDEMIAWLRDCAIRAEARGLLGDDASKADAAMLRAIAARLRGPEVAAERAMEIHDIEVQLGFERVYAKSAARPDVRRQAVGNVARLEARLAELRAAPSAGITHAPPSYEAAPGNVAMPVFGRKG